MVGEGSQPIPTLAPQARRRVAGSRPGARIVREEPRRPGMPRVVRRRDERSRGDGRKTFLPSDGSEAGINDRPFFVLAVGRRQQVFGGGADDPDNAILPCSLA